MFFFSFCRPKNKIDKATELEIELKLDQSVRPDPSDGTKRVFASQEANGIKRFHEKHFPSIPLSTFRAILDRYKARKNILLIRRIEHDHCVCPTCASLTHTLETAKGQLSLSKDAATQKQLNEEVRRCQQALDEHVALHSLQRRGMQILVDKVRKEEPDTFAAHFDAKSKYQLPFFHQELRPDTNAKFVVQAFGNILALFSCFSVS